jgi:DNA polymerase-3 subunit alpha
MWDLEDLDGLVRCILWPEQFAQHAELVKADAILALRGKVDRRPGKEEVNVIVDELIPLADLATRFSSGVVIRVREEDHGERGLEQLREILRGYPGPKKIRLRLDLATGGKVWLDSGALRIDATSELRRRVEDLLGPGSFSLQAAPTRPQPVARTNGDNARRREPART